MQDPASSDHFHWRHNSTSPHHLPPGLEPRAFLPSSTLHYFQQSSRAVLSKHSLDYVAPLLNTPQCFLPHSPSKNQIQFTMTHSALTCNSCPSRVTTDHTWLFKLQLKLNRIKNSVLQSQQHISMFNGHMWPVAITWYSPDRTFPPPLRLLLDGATLYKLLLLIISLTH